MLNWSENGEVRVQLVEESGRQIALSNVLLDVIFYVSGIRRYTFPAGATDPAGVCIIEMAQIKQKLIENQKTFLMDYNTPLSSCDSAIGIVAPSAEELSRRVSAAKKWFPEEADLIVSQVAISNNNKITSVEQKIEIGPESTKFNMTYVCTMLV